MKPLTALIALGLSAFALSAQAQPANVIGPGINSPAYALVAPKEASWPSSLLGEWVGAEDLLRGIPAGSITLGVNKEVQIAPKDMYVLKGYWYAVPGNKLIFDTPLDKGEASYLLENKGNTLTLKYANGMSQTLSRATRSKTQDKK